MAQLLAVVAHDFNNILSVIRLNADVGREIAKQPGVTELFEEIETAAARGAALTNQLVMVSRQETIAPEPTDIARVALDLQALLRRVFGERIALEIVDTTRSAPIVLADRSQLEQVFMNLAVNAKDAIGETGNVTIAISDEGESRVQVAVTDDGSGMSEETIARAFEAFYTTKDPGKGTGLGLATIDGIVKGIGGTARIESALGRGTTVVLVFPRSG